jgi:hypothetical protein
MEGRRWESEEGAIAKTVKELKRQWKRLLLVSHSPASWWLLPMAPLIAHSYFRLYAAVLAHCSA